MHSRRMVTAMMVGALVARGSALAQATPKLADVFKGKFVVGAAINESQFTGRDTAGVALITAQFNAISPENVLKWEIVHPTATGFNFAPSDAYVAFGEARKMFILGHTLVWHSQTPKWVFEDDKGAPLTRDALLARMRYHIRRLLGVTKGA